MGFSSNIFNRKSVTYKDHSGRKQSINYKDIDGVRVYNWGGYYRAMSKSLESFLDSVSGQLLANDIIKNSNGEAIYNIIKNMVADGVKKTILYKCDFYDTIRPLFEFYDKFHLSIQPIISVNRNTSFSAVFSMEEIENTKYLIHFLDKSSYTGIDYSDRLIQHGFEYDDLKNHVVYIDLEPIENVAALLLQCHTEIIIENLINLDLI